MPTPESQAADAAKTERLMAAVEAEFGDRLDDAAREHIRRQCARIVTQGNALAAYPLPAATEPMLVFNPIRPS